MSSNICDLFNNNVINFLTELEKISHLKNNFKKKKIYVMLLIKLNKKKLLDLFEEVYIYKNNINNHDINIIDEIDKNVFFDDLNIKELWKILNDQNKLQFWNYMITFCKIYEKYKKIKI